MVLDAMAWNVPTSGKLYTPPVLRYCRLRGLQDADAADVTQEVMAQVARSMRSIRYAPVRGRFRDWLGTITRRKVNRLDDDRDLDPLRSRSDFRALLTQAINTPGAGK